MGLAVQPDARLLTIWGIGKLRTGEWRLSADWGVLIGDYRTLLICADDEYVGRGQ
jgi:hypothetical protein